MNSKAGSGFSFTEIFEIQMEGRTFKCGIVQMLFLLNLPSSLSEEEEKYPFLWKKLGHCFFNLQEPTSINHKTAA